MPKIKPVLAWGVLTEHGSIHIHSSWTEAEVREYASAFREEADVIRVRISVVPKAKRKVNK